MLVFLPAQNRSIILSEQELSDFIADGKKVNVSHDAGWSVNETGVYHAKKLVSSPVWIKQTIMSLELGHFKVVINGITPINGVIFEHVTDYASLQGGFNNQLMKDLGNMGMKLQHGASKSLFEFLSQQQGVPTVYSFDKLGWHTTNAKQVFVLPSQVLGSQLDNHFIYMPDSTAPSQRALVASGTLEEWQRNVVSACIDNPVALFALGIAFAAPLMRLFNVDGGGFHFWGASSRGKTLLLQIAATVFGNGADPALLPDGSLIQRWNTTANALEGTALAFNDLLLPMDELGTSNIKNFGQAIYQLSGGVGKRAMNANRDMRAVRAWKVMIISSGEHAITHEIEAKTGVQARAGQLIRFIDISVDNIFPAWGDVTEAKKKADALKVACSQYYGVAALPFLEYVVKTANHEPSMQRWHNQFEIIEDGLANENPNLQPEQRRAIKRFALVACGLLMAKDAGCIAVKDETIMDAVLNVLKLWLTEFPTVSEAERGIEHIKHFILTNPNRFGNANYAHGSGNNLVGYRHASEHLNLYLVPKENMVEVCGRANYGAVVKKLDELGMLLKNNTNNNGSYRPTYKLKLANGHYVSGYAISFQLLADTVSVAA
jgi:putative DNA primase/helicase